MNLEIGRRGADLETLRLFTLKAPVWQAFIPVAIGVCSVGAANSDATQTLEAFASWLLERRVD
jgi:hypothetical protein